MKTSTKIIIALVLILGLPAIGLATNAIWFAHRTEQVVKQEVDPQVLLNKYMWLKEAMSSLDAKKATIDADQTNIDAMLASYKGVPRNQWAEMDAVQYNQWQTEQNGVKQSYNNLASDYNAKMAEVNWAFTNVGQLPHGQSQTLPREYRNYITQ